MSTLNKFWKINMLRIEIMQPKENRVKLASVWDFVLFEKSRCLPGEIELGRIFREKQCLSKIYTANCFMWIVSDAIHNNST